jgi:hypothetical protein
MSYYRSRPATRNASYKGRSYRLMWSGTTKTGKDMAKLAFLDGSKEFWVALDLVSVESAHDAEERRELAMCRKRFRETGDYYGSGLYDAES